MNRNFLIILTLTLATAAGPLAAADGTNAVPPGTPARPAPVKADNNIDYRSFRIITERNIFDMSRSGGRIRNQTVHRAKVDYFTLVGASSYEKGQFAFFDGSSSLYRKTCKLAETIAGYRVTAIGSDHVELQSTNSQTIKMAVGTTIRREDNGPWSAPIVQSESFADTGSRDRERGDRGSKSDAGGRTDKGSNTYPDLPPASEIKSDAASSGGSEDDVIKRLMQKRAKEVKDDQ